MKSDDRVGIMHQAPFAQSLAAQQARDNQANGVRTETGSPS